MLFKAAKGLIYKIIGLYVRIRYYKISRELQHFYKATYYCELAQVKYFFKDYIYKKKYKTISFKGEFGAELLYVIPFAYWHYKNGTLKTTESSKFTSEMYFFSPDHHEAFETRTNEGNEDYEMPRVLYSQDYNMSKWTPVPLKDNYRNSIYKFEKPILIIANRYNMEWDGPPISFLSIPLLEFILTNLKEHYTIIYNRPKPKNIINDHSDVYDLNEFEWLEKEHPEVLLMEDLYKENKGNAKNFNHLQLMVYANCEHFISVHGGTATLASYFGGTNVILSKKGPEYHFNCWQKLFTKLSGARIFAAKTDDEFKRFVLENYAKPVATINVK